MNVSVPSVPLHLLQRCNMSGKILFNLALELYNCTIVLISLILCLELVEHSCQLLSHSSIINYLKPELKFPQPFKCSCIGIHVSLYREIKIRKCILGSNVSTVLSELWGHISSKLTFPYTISNLQISVKFRGRDITCALELLKQHKITKRGLIIEALSNDNQAGQSLHSLAVPLYHHDTVFNRVAQ